MSLLLLLRPLAAPVGPQPPSITSFLPISGPIGQVVVIAGNNFTAATDVSFNGTSALIFSVDSAIQITATVPVGTTTGTISVTTAIGTGTSATPFTVTVPSTATAPGPIGAKRRPIRLKYEEFQRSSDYLKTLNFRRFGDDSEAIKEAERKRLAKQERREAEMRSKAAQEEAIIARKEAEISASARDAEIAADAERIAKINKAILTMIIMASEDDS